VSGVSLARGTWALPLVTQVGYQPFGPMSSIAFGHGQTLSKQWDRNYEPDAITSPAIDYDYTLDDVGNLTRIQSAIEGEQRYGYDNLDRLQSIREQNEALIESFAYDTAIRRQLSGQQPPPRRKSRAGGCAALIESFAYDATGNRTSHTVGVSTTSYSYPGSSHRLEQVGSQARAFDAAGNTVSGIAGSSFAFDARNRLVEVNAGGAIRQRMNYNGRGERVLSAEGNPAPAWPSTSSAWAQAAAAGVRATVYANKAKCCPPCAAAIPCASRRSQRLGHPLFPTISLWASGRPKRPFVRTAIPEKSQHAQAPAAPVLAWWVDQSAFANRLLA
jgi:hypothetical protein